MTKALFVKKPIKDLVQLSAIMHSLKKRNRRHTKKKIIVNSKALELSVSKPINSSLKEPIVRLERMSHTDCFRFLAGVGAGKSILEECHNPPDSLSHHSVHEHKEQIETVLLKHRHELFSTNFLPSACRHVIRTKALEIADALHVPRKKFKGTNKWLNSFLEQCEHSGYITAAFKLKTTECTDNIIKTSCNNLPTSHAIQNLKFITSDECLKRPHHILKPRSNEKSSPIHISQNNGHLSRDQNEFLPKSEVESLLSKGSNPKTLFSKCYTEPSLPAFETSPNDAENFQLQSKNSFTAQVPKLEDLFAVPPVSSHRKKYLDIKKCCRNLYVKNSTDFLLPDKVCDYRFLKVSAHRFKPSKYVSPTFSDDIYEKLFIASNEKFGTLHEKKQVDKGLYDEDVESGYGSGSVSCNSQCNDNCVVATNEPDKLLVSFQPADTTNIVLGALSYSSQSVPQLRCHVNTSSVTSKPSALCGIVANDIDNSTKLPSISSDKSSTSEHSIFNTTFPDHCDIGSNENLKKFSNEGATINKTISEHSVEMLSERIYNHDDNMLTCCESMEYEEHHNNNWSSLTDVYNDNFDISNIKFHNIDDTYFNADMVNDESWVDSLFE